MTELIVQPGDLNQANWKNVGNWHWTTKNCTKWAEDYLKETLEGMTATEGGTTVTITSVSKVTGDADLNQRKGRLMTLYDLQVELKWTGKTSDGKTGDGQIKVPEVAQDTDDYVFDVDGPDPYRAIVKRHLAKNIEKVFQGFEAQLIEQNSKDVRLEKHELGPRNASTDLESRRVEKDLDKKVARDTSVPTKDQQSKSTAKSKDKGGVLNTVTVDQRVEFTCSSEQLFDVLTKQDFIKQWTRGSMRVVQGSGQMFMFGDSVEIMTVEQERPTKLVWLWRTSAWKKDHYSTVTLELVPSTMSTTLKLKQDGVPVGEEDSTKENWNRYYWQVIKSVFGFGTPLR